MESGVNHVLLAKVLKVFLVVGFFPLNTIRRSSQVDNL